MSIRKIPLSDGAKLAVHCVGEPASEALVICYGLGADHNQWVEDAAYFAKDRSVIIVDLKGHGQSTYPANATKKDFTVERLAQEVAEALTALNIVKYDFLGNSLGGLIGLSLCQQDASRVRSLITCGTTYELHFPKLVVWTRWAMFKLLSDQAIGKMVAKGATKKDYARPVIKQMFSHIDRKVMYWIDSDIYDYDYLSAAENFAGRICLLRGADDKEINAKLASTENLLRDMPRATVIDMPDTGHFTNLDQPDLFRKHVSQFLSEEG